MAKKLNFKKIDTSGGMFNEMLLRIKLILRLMGDRRVSPLLKLLPIASLVYLVVPTDFLPLLPFDDAAVILLASYLFVELAPPEIVQEHMAIMNNVIPGAWQDPNQPPQDANTSKTSNTIDSEFWKDNP
jgi:uncharacterized membrane protein YkvA (DUF1232 family)